MKLLKYAAPLFLLSPALYAQDENCEDCGVQGLSAGDFYLSVQGGVSFSNNADLQVLTGPNQFTDWDPAPEGYGGNVGDSELFGASLGYAIVPLTVVELEVVNRSSFQYEKQQTGQFPKTRNFDLNDTTVMASFIFNGSGLRAPFVFEKESFMLDPFIKIGAGMAFNTVSNFYSTRPDGTTSATMNDHTETSFAYQLGAGVNLRTDSPWVVSLAYRYLNAGDFESDDYLTNAGISISPWNGELSANEVYLAVSYVFNL